MPAAQRPRVHPMTVLSLLRPVLSWPPGGVGLQRLILGIGERRPPTTIRRLSFIHFARLAIIRRIPALGQPADDLRQPLLLFESNYNGSFDEYIDTFAATIPVKMMALWATSYGFPGVEPVTPLKRFIRANEFHVDHYYCAYPQATTAMVSAALRLKRRHLAFYERARTLEPEAFAREYRAFLTFVQGEL